MNYALSANGQSLIEVLFAIGLVMLVLVTLVGGLVVGVRNNRSAREQSLAKAYVREGAEYLRNVRARLGWETFTQLIRADGSSPIRYCLSVLPETDQEFEELENAACSSGEFIGSSIFLRQADITIVSATQLRVRMRVLWTDRGEQTESFSEVTFIQPL